MQGEMTVVHDESDSFVRMASILLPLVRNAMEISDVIDKTRNMKVTYLGNSIHAVRRAFNVSGELSNTTFALTDDIREGEARSAFFVIPIAAIALTMFIGLVKIIWINFGFSISITKSKPSWIEPQCDVDSIISLTPSEESDLDEALWCILGENGVKEGNNDDTDPGRHKCCNKPICADLHNSVVASACLNPGEYSRDMAKKRCRNEDDEAFACLFAKEDIAHDLFFTDADEVNHTVGWLS